MKTIWKYQLEIVDEQYVTMPIISSTVHLAPKTSVIDVRWVQSRQDQILGEKINLWATVDTDSESTDVKFFIVGTGYLLPKSGVYIGTVPMPSGLVWHVFTEWPAK